MRTSLTVNECPLLAESSHKERLREHLYSTESEDFTSL